MDTQVECYSTGAYKNQTVVQSIRKMHANKMKIPYKKVPQKGALCELYKTTLAGLIV